MSITVNDGGVLRTLGTISVNDGGVLKKQSVIYANDGGVLKQVFSAGTPINNYGVGSTVKIRENGAAVDYLIVHKGLPASFYDSSCNGIWLLREKAHSAMAFNSASSSYSHGGKYFGSSEIKTWLDNTFLNSLDSTIRTAIKTANVPYNSKTSTLSVKAFLLSAYEVGFVQDSDDGTSYHNIPIDGEMLSYFEKFTNSLRVCKNSSNTAVPWWTRSSNIASWAIAAWAVGQSGEFPKTQYPETTTSYVRPAFILPTTVRVDSSGFITV